MSSFVTFHRGGENHQDLHDSYQIRGTPHNRSKLQIKINTEVTNGHSEKAIMEQYYTEEFVQQETKT